MALQPEELRRPDSSASPLAIGNHSKDKSKKQNKMEWAARQLKRILAAELPSQKTVVYVAEGFARIQELDTISID
eukprot:1210656-Karenia_brevis.AAC.1